MRFTSKMWKPPSSTTFTTGSTPIYCRQSKCKWYTPSQISTRTSIVAKNYQFTIKVERSMPAKLRIYWRNSWHIYSGWIISLKESLKFRGFFSETMTFWLCRISSILTSKKLKNCIWWLCLATSNFTLYVIWPANISLYCRMWEMR